MRPLNVLFLLFSTQGPIFDVKCEEPKSGPYVSVPVRSEHCKRHRGEVYQKDPSTLFDGYLYKSMDGTMRVKGNVTFIRPEPNVRTKGRMYRKEDGEWKIIYMINNKGCTGVIITTVLWAFGLDFDGKKCSIRKGTFPIDVDPNKLEHLWSNTREYGELLWVVQMSVGKQIIICWEHEAVVMPLTTKNKN